MSKFSDTINQYFIDMVKNPQTKDQLTTRMNLTEEERLELPIPHTYTVADAFYVDLGCRFQDNPLKSLVIFTGFIIVVGVLIAQFILSFVN